MWVRPVVGYFVMSTSTSTLYEFVVISTSTNIWRPCMEGHTRPKYWRKISWKISLLSPKSQNFTSKFMSATSPGHEIWRQISWPGKKSWISFHEYCRQYLSLWCPFSAIGVKSQTWNLSSNCLTWGKVADMNIAVKFRDSGRKSQTWNLTSNLAILGENSVADHEILRQISRIRGKVVKFSMNFYVNI